MQSIGVEVDTEPVRELHELALAADEVVKVVRLAGPAAVRAAGAVGSGRPGGHGRQRRGVLGVAASDDEGDRDGERATE